MRVSKVCVNPIGFKPMVKESNSIITLRPVTGFPDKQYVGYYQIFRAVSSKFKPNRFQQNKSTGFSGKAYIS